MTRIATSLGSFIVWLTRDLGRPYTALFGTAVAGAALTLPSNRNTVANMALVVGGVLVALGGLVPWFRHARWKHGSLEFEDPEFQRQRARLARQVSEEQRTPGVSFEASTALDATRLYVATQALGALFNDTVRYAPGFDNCSFRLFLYDALRERLVATLSAPGRDEASREWKVGEGVAGVSYRDAEYVIASGDSAHDETFGLDESAQRYYSDLTEVAAAPILSASRNVIGVLSVSHNEDATILDTSEGRRGHLLAATACARIVVDLLGWRSDD